MKTRFIEWAKLTRSQWSALGLDDRLGLWLNFLIFLAAAVAVFFTFKQWRVASDTLEGTTRAWVVSGDEIEMTCPAAGQGPQVEYFLVNNGQRPAVNLRMETQVIIVSGGPGYRFPDDPPYDHRHSRDNAPSLGVIGTDQKTHDIIYGDALTPQQAAGLLDGSWTYFLYGRVEYEDGFGKTRHTKWCRRWEPMRGCNVYRFVFCGSYNSAD